MQQRPRFVKVSQLAFKATINLISAIYALFIILIIGNFLDFSYNCGEFLKYKDFFANRAISV